MLLKYEYNNFSLISLGYTMLFQYILFLNSYGIDILRFFNENPFETI